MEWNLRLNGDPVTLQIPDVGAVWASLETPPPVVESVTETIEESAVDAFAPYDHRERDHQVFERAGWRFIQPESLEPHIVEAVAPPRAEPLRPVFITDRGDILVGTDVATVQLNAAAMTTRATAEKVLAEDGLTILHQLSFLPHLYAVRLPSASSLTETIDRLQAKTDRYVFAEPSMLQRISGRQTPTDQDFKDQWQHAEKLVDGKGGFGLNSEPAWEITKGVIKNVNPQRPVRVAIIDNGMDIDHVDLNGAIIGGGFFTAIEIGSGDANFTRFTPNMSDFPKRGHGTFCLGMVGARQNNVNGGCGVAPESHLIAIACARDQVGNQLTLARSIEFAIDPKAVDPEGPLTFGADIISCSLRTASVLETVLKTAIDHTATGRGGLGIPIFWAVSNTDPFISTDKVCSLERVIAVGRSNRDGASDGSASGPKLEFLAPGRKVFGPTEGSDNVFDSGTSFAAPLAAGVAALVLALHPDWTADQVRQHLRATCSKPNGHDHDDEFGFGLVNAHKAVQ